MDKASVALSATEDNAAAIRELNKKLNSRTECKLIVGNTGNGLTSFGNITSSGNTAVVVVYSSTSAARLMFNGEDISYSVSPLLGVLPEGTGLLQISNTRAAVALIIG